MPSNETPASSHPRSAWQSTLRVGCMVGLLLLLIPTLLWTWFYVLDSHHANRDSIGPGRIYSLTPPTATNITLQKDFLDHYATYIVLEKDLNAFLDKRFRTGDEVLHSFEDRSKPDASEIGQPLQHFGWIVTEDMVVYHYTASNGGGHTYYHNPTTGWTYQDSAHW